MAAAQQIEPQLSAVTHAVGIVLQDFKDFGYLRHAEINEKVEAGRHRFDIHPGQIAFLHPQGFLVDREEDRLKRLARNAAAIKLWENRYVEVTDDGFIVREDTMPKPKLKLVSSNGA